jgi:5-methylcytosine-specific restriction endonuclease McrBC GTP-binding regulatory subunit McrB
MLHSLDDATTENGATIPPNLHIPSNVFFTGTVNVDETTYMFSPKVLDRAFTIG